MFVFKTGANVTIAARSKETAEKTLLDLENASQDKTKQKFLYLPIDTSLMADVKRFIADVEPTYRNEGLHVLVLSAGGVPSVSRSETAEGIEKYFATNYLSRSVYTP
jgi:NAD(P)-dependent dehydrogenase (short-subunit alcohol dehydrogenase family)